MSAPESAPLDPGLQLERTLLAWRRFALGLVAGGLLMTHLLGGGHARWGGVAGLAALGTSLALLVVSHRRLGRPESLVVPPPFVALLLGVVAVVLLAAAGLAWALG
jgi:hypothetical protein